MNENIIITYTGKRGEMKGKEFVIILDDAGLKLYNRYPWYVGKQGNGYYLIRTDKNKTVRFHREIMSAKKGQEIDHISRDTLDNRKCNLRIVTSSQNNMNSGMQKNNSSGHRGVFWYKRSNKWRVQIRLNSKLYHLGYFTDYTLACQTYDGKAKELFGEYLGETGVDL